MAAQTTPFGHSGRLYGFPDEFDVIVNTELSVTFNLTYSFWLIPETDDVYTVKIDTLIQNIDLDLLIEFYFDLNIST
ncbi:MAG: hypothetical protein GF364_08960 [Candidatus Lokiarchaeota archaeon]|nr:hypothetical protein [Candidatus Lokiarchaeota archaeon]